MQFKKTAITVLALFINQAAYALQQGDVAPSLSLPKLATGQLTEIKAYRGKVIYLDFWASWCPPCRTSFPLLDKLSQRHNKDAFQIVAVNLDEDTAAVQDFLKRYPVHFDILRDPSGQSADRYEVAAMPTSFIIDRKGVIRSIHKGFAKDDIVELEKIINRLLAESL